MRIYHMIFLEQVLVASMLSYLARVARDREAIE